MRRLINSLFIILLQTFFPQNAFSLVYPKAHHVDHTDVYHGIKVSDPYCWLEDLNSKETKAWIDAENKLSESYLKNLPYRDRIRKRFYKLYNYEAFNIPYKVGGHYFYKYNSGLQNQDMFYVMDSLNSVPKLFLDPNTNFTNLYTTVENYLVSKDARFIAYSTSVSGSDWMEWHVREIDTQKDLSDHINKIKFSSVSWLNNAGFFYSGSKPKSESDAEKNYVQKLYYHKLGTSETEDKLIFESPEKEMMIKGTVTEDEHYLIISVSKVNLPNDAIYYKDLTKPNSPIVHLIERFDAGYAFVSNDGDIFWVRTDLNAPNERVIAINVKHPERNNWKTLIPEKKIKIDYVRVLNNSFVIAYLKDGINKVDVFNLEGKFLKQIKLPGLGVVNGISGGDKDKETFYSFSNALVPPTIYHYDFDSNKSSIFFKPKIPFDSSRYEIKQVNYSSKDGTSIPMFLVHKKEIKLDGKNPVLLYGYGGFGEISIPRFSVFKLIWLGMGGVFAEAGIRGGGEKGEAWHQAGIKTKKQNSFDDFISAAEWLIAKQYTTSQKLAIMGGSNGGLLVGACITQRPELFKVAIPMVGVFDMLRFDQFTSGWAWIPEYGSPHVLKEFKYLHSYSPLHNVKLANYPAMLIWAAKKDDRVVPSHSYKFAAAMQTSQKGSSPVLIRIENNSGHGLSGSTTESIDASVDMLAFLAHYLGMSVDKL